MEPFKSVAENIRSIVIVGGGTAGWLAALTLIKRFPTPSHGSVVLVESPNIPTIGVGESTIPFIRKTLSSLGIDEDEFMRRTDATFKVAVKFRGWAGDESPSSFWSPFAPFPSPRTLQNLIRSHLQLGDASSKRPFDYSAFPSTLVAEAFRSPKFGTEAPYMGQVHYAYHLDAVLLAEFLSEQAVARGVVRYQENVVNVILNNNNGFIESVLTENGRRLSGDLFIDCSG